MGANDSRKRITLVDSDFETNEGILQTSNDTLADSSE